MKIRVNVIRVGFIRSENTGLINPYNIINKCINKTSGGSDNDYAYSVQLTTDGGYIVAGGTYSYGSGSNDVWLIKTDTEGGG